MRLNPARLKRQGGQHLPRGERKGQFAAVSHKFSFLRKKSQSMKTVTGNKKFVGYPHQAKLNVPVTLGFQEQNITILHKDKTTKLKKRQYWSGHSGLDHSLEAELDLQSLN